MKIGDQIQVQINGGEEGTTLGDPGSATITIGPGASMSVSGVIVGDLISHWQVKLSMSVGGNDLIRVPKQ